MKGRTIFDAVRTIDDIMEFTERYQMKGLLVAIDFQKAFDSINHDFMFKALSVFNFGPSLIRWIQIFYKNISSTVMNGYTTALFKIFRGVRQGDLLSPYLFIICLEILAINVRLNKDIRGIMVGNEEIKLEIFADDMTAFLRDHASLDALLNMVIDSFSLHSGLKINFEKTEVLFLGNDQKSTTETVISLARNRNITAKKAIKILGVHFTYDQTLWRKLNFDETLKTIKERLNSWNWRNLGVFR